MHKLLELFTSKRDIKEATKEVKRSNGDIVTTKTTITSTSYTIPEDIKKVLSKEVYNIIRDKKGI